MQHIDQKKILASFYLTGAWKGKDLVVALVERGISMDVARGENAGRRLKHEHVVKQFQRLAPNDSSGSFTLNTPPLAKLERYSIIAYIQDNDITEILAGTQLDLPLLAP